MAYGVIALLVLLPMKETNARSLDILDGDTSVPARASVTT
jgi:hypothetical protein